MNSPIIQLLVLAGIAIFLILRLRSVLGSREGFEKPPEALPPERGRSRRPELEVIDGTPDRDIVDNVPENSGAARALAQMKRVEPSFNVTEFLTGARGAYEMILMAFETGDLEKVRPFLASEVYDAFAAVVAERKAAGQTVTANFIGLRELALQDAEFDRATGEAELTVRFVGELISVVRDSAGQIVAGDPKTSRKQRDVWTFGRTMGSSDPNWQLVATGE